MPTKSLIVLTRQFGDIDDELIGDGVRIVRLADSTRKQIYKQNIQQIRHWDLFYDDYNHALVNTYDSNGKSDYEADQELVRASIAIRIVQPFSSGFHLVMTAEGPPEAPRFAAHGCLGIGAVNFVCASDVEKRVTRDHVRKARALWPGIQIVGQQLRTHRRLLRALRFFDIACSNSDAGIRHILFHAGLETLLCTNREYLTQQVYQRALAICGNKVTKKDLKEITEMRGSLAHSGAIPEKTRSRGEEIIQKLERILRACLYHALSDLPSVETFSDDQKLKAAFPVCVKKIEHKETGETIYV